MKASRREEGRRRFSALALLSGTSPQVTDAAFGNLKEERFQPSFITASESPQTRARDRRPPLPQSCLRSPLSRGARVDYRRVKKPPRPPRFSPQLCCCRPLRKHSSYRPSPRSLPLSPSSYQPGNQSATGYLKPI